MPSDPTPAPMTASEAALIALFRRASPAGRDAIYRRALREMNRSLGEAQAPGRAPRAPSDE